MELFGVLRGGLDAPPFVSTVHAIRAFLGLAQLGPIGVAQPVHGENNLSEIEANVKSADDLPFRMS